MNIETEFAKIKEQLSEGCSVTNIKFLGKKVLLVFTLWRLAEYVYIFRVNDNGELKYCFSPSKSNFESEFGQELLKEALALDK